MAYIMQIFDKGGHSHIVCSPSCFGFWENILYRARSGESDPLSTCIRAIGESNLSCRLLEEVEDQFTERAIGKYIRRFPQTLLQLGQGDRRAVTFRVTNTRTGASHVITNLSRFCKENGLSKGTLSKTLTGERSHTHGWRLEKPGILKANEGE